MVSARVLQGTCARADLREASKDLVGSCRPQNWHHMSIRGWCHQATPLTNSRRLSAVPHELLRYKCAAKICPCILSRPANMHLDAEISNWLLLWRDGWNAVRVLSNDSNQHIQQRDHILSKADSPAGGSSISSRWESTSTIMCPDGPASGRSPPWVESTSIPPSADDTKRSVVERVLETERCFTVVFDGEARRRDRL